MMLVSIWPIRTCTASPLLAFAILMGCGGDAAKTLGAKDGPAQQDVADPATPTPAAHIDAPALRETSEVAVEQEPVTMKVAPLAVGDTRTETAKFTMDTLLESVGAGGSKQILTEQSRDFIARLKITEVGPSGPTKGELVYERRADQTLQNGKAVQRHVPPTEGKPYTLVRGEKGTTVTYADGTDIPRKELNTVLDANYFFHRPGRFEALIPDGELAPGHEIELEEALVAPLFEDRSRRGQTVKTAKLTYRGIAKEQDRKAAAFRLDVVLERLEGPLVYTMTLAGDVLVEPGSGRLIRAVLQGPVTVVGEPGAHGGIQMKGKGVVTLDATATFARPG